MPYITPTEYQNVLLKSATCSELADSLENAAIEVHVMRRDNSANDIQRNGHAGSFWSCPSYGCVKARQLIKKARQE